MCIKEIRRGQDIGAVKIDELDINAMYYAISAIHGGRQLTVIDVGCGLGSAGIRFAGLGAAVFLYDMTDNVSQFIQAMKRQFPYVSITLTIKDISKLENEDIPSQIDVLFSQRTLHYLKYQQSESFLRLISARMCKDAKAFISVSGINSELSRGYSDIDKDVRARFATLSGDVAKKHRIFEPVCLYKPDELRQLFCQNGFTCERVWLSEFGNVKGIFRRE